MDTMPGVYQSEARLVISLDFGTTFSGIAFCFKNRSEVTWKDVFSIVHWPGAEHQSEPRIPTLISYDPNDSETFSWGASVYRTTNDTIVGVKHLLDPSRQRARYLPTRIPNRDSNQFPKPPVKIAADFIGAMYQHALEEIDKQLGSHALSTFPKHFVLSVPTAWSDAANNATLQAAKTAGFFPVTLVKEPEAAALYTIHSLNINLNAGDAFVICDAGGGMVDLISYEVIATTPNVQLRELVRGTDSMAGSLGLKQRFVEAVKTLVGEDQFHKLQKTKGLWLVAEYFDRVVKNAFRGQPEEKYFIPFPREPALKDDKEAGLKSNTWRITGKDLEAIFSPPVTDILRRIDDQIKSVHLKRPDRGVTALVLVGGFSKSRYLKSRVKKHHPWLQVLQPDDAWAAVAKGAVLSQILPEVCVGSTSVTRLPHGVEALIPINHNHDKGYQQTSGETGPLGSESICIATTSAPSEIAVELEKALPSSLKKRKLSHGWTNTPPYLPARQEAGQRTTGSSSLAPRAPRPVFFEPKPTALGSHCSLHQVRDTVVKLGKRILWLTSQDVDSESANDEPEPDSTSPDYEDHVVRLARNTLNIALPTRPRGQVHITYDEDGEDVIELGPSPGGRRPFSRIPPLAPTWHY